MIKVLTHTGASSVISATAHSMVLEDGTQLFYRAWIPEEPTRKALVLFHRGHEHSGRLEDVVRELRLPDVAIFAWDARGHGRSSGRRGFAPSFGCLAADADEFIRHISETHGYRVEDIVVVGHSVGAVMLAAWVHDYAPPIRAMVLVTPALRVKLYVPFARTGLRLMQMLVRRSPMFVSSYVKGHLLTHDPEQARRYNTDPLTSRAIAVNVLLGLHDTASRLLSDARTIQTPALVLAGDADWVVDLSAEREFFERLGSRVKRMRVLRGMYHDILHEKDRRPVLDEIKDFVLSAYMGEEISRATEAAEHTHNEYERLRAPLSRFSPRRLRFAVERALLKTVGRLSEGIRLGCRAGFDSGSSLDYVYENNPRGFLFLGRIIDRFYLKSPGWAGIRQRKVNIEKTLHDAIESIIESGAPVRILDVAAGQGRYIIDTLGSMSGQNVTALVRDYEESNVQAARALVSRRGVNGITCEQADAFDEASYSSIVFRPNIAIVSGLFELFPDNTPVRRCLEGIAGVIEKDGYLIYTGQPWHPQIEMIARVLTNRNGEPWVMRRRSQLELDELVRAAGFEKIRTRVDEHGIFTVSIAKMIVDRR